MGTSRFACLAIRRGSPSTLRGPLSKHSRPLGLIVSFVVLVAAIVGAVALRRRRRPAGRRPSQRAGLHPGQPLEHRLPPVRGLGRSRRHPLRGQRPRGTATSGRSVDLAEIPGNPLAAPTVDDTHNVYAIAVDAGRRRPRRRQHARRPAPLRPLAGGTRAHRLGGAAGAERLGKRHLPGLHGPARRHPAVLEAQRLLRRGRRRRRRARARARGAGDRSGSVLDGTAERREPLPAPRRGRPRHGRHPLDVRVARTPETSRATPTSATPARSTEGGAGSAATGPPTRAPSPMPRPRPSSPPQPGSGLLNGGGLTLDSAGDPHGLVTFDTTDGKALEHVWLDDGNWRSERLEDTFADTRSQIAGTPDGRVWALVVRGASLEAIDVTPDRDRVDDREIADVPLGWEPSFDSEALARFGTVETLIPDGVGTSCGRGQPRRSLTGLVVDDLAVVEGRRPHRLDAVLPAVQVAVAGQQPVGAIRARWSGARGRPGPAARVRARSPSPRPGASSRCPRRRRG